jgi:hypothetical protein
METDIGKRGEDPFQDLAYGVLTDTLSAARVVFEDGILGMHRENGLYVVVIPRFSVSGNDLFKRMLSAHSIPLEPEAKLLINRVPSSSDAQRLANRPGAPTTREGEDTYRRVRLSKVRG